MAFAPNIALRAALLLKEDEGPEFVLTTMAASSLHASGWYVPGPGASSS